MHRSKQHLYSITSSAIESNPGGTSMPSAIADIAPLARSKIKKPSTEVAYLFGSTF
jgi:hypothetical protein